jgi:hypothetical protein
MGQDWIDEDEGEVGADEEAIDGGNTLELLVLHREVSEPMHVKIEAHVSKDGTFIKFWHVLRDEKFYHVFLDCMEPEPILNAMVQRFEQGKFRQMITFIEEVGKAIRDPIEFRLKLDSYMGATAILDVPISQSDPDDEVF